MGTRGDRHVLAFVKRADRSETIEPRSLLQRCIRGHWMPGISLSWGVGGCSFSFFSLCMDEKGGGEGGSRSAAVLGARLATAVSYSIF